MKNFIGCFIVLFFCKSVLATVGDSLPCARNFYPHIQGLTGIKLPTPVEKSFFIMYVIPIDSIFATAENTYKIPHPGYPNSCERVVSQVVDSLEIVPLIAAYPKSRKRYVAITLTVRSGIPDPLWRIIDNTEAIED